MGAHFEALDEGVLLVPLDPRYTQVGFNLVSVQVCKEYQRFSFLHEYHFCWGDMSSIATPINMLISPHSSILNDEWDK